MSKMKTNSFINIFLFIAAGLLVSFGFLIFGFWWGQKRALIKTSSVVEESLRKEQLVEELEKIDLSQTSPILTEWKSYSNYEHGFSIRHPENVLVQVNADGSVSVVQKDENLVDGINLLFDSYLLGQRPLKEIVQQSLAPGTVFNQISLAGQDGYSTYLNEVGFVYLPAAYEGRYLIVTNRSLDNENKGYQSTANQILLTLQLVRRGDEQNGEKAKVGWQPEVLEQAGEAGEDEVKVGGGEAEWEQQPDWQADWIEPDLEEEEVVPEWEEMADDVDNDGLPDERDPLVVLRDDDDEKEEAVDDSGLITARSLDCGFELLYPEFMGGKDERYRVHFFDNGDCEFTVISWRNREEHDVLFSFIFSVDRLEGEDITALAAREALAWTEMFGQRIAPQAISIGGREAWLIAYNNMYTIFLHQRGERLSGFYIQITAYDHGSLQLARMIFESMRTF